MLRSNPWEALPRLVAPLMADGDGDGDQAGAGAGGSGDSGDAGGGGGAAGGGRQGLAGAVQLDAGAAGDGGGGVDGAGKPDGDGGATGEGGKPGDDGTKPDGGQGSGDGADSDAPKLIFAERPDHIPAQFYDKETGAVDVEGLAKSHAFMREKISNGGDKVPKTPDGYELAIPKDLSAAADRFITKDEDGNIDDPMLSAFREFAHKQGVSSQLFSEFVGFYVGFQNEQAGPEVSTKEMLTEIGGNDSELGQRIVNHLGQQIEALKLSGAITDDEHKAAWDTVFCDPQTVGFFMKALEWGGEQPIPNTVQELHQQPSLEAMAEKQADLKEQFDSGKIDENKYNREMQKLIDSAEKAA